MSKCPPGVRSLDDLPVLASARMEVVFDPEDPTIWHYVRYIDEGEPPLPIDLSGNCQALIRSVQTIKDLPVQDWIAFVLNGELHVLNQGSEVGTMSPGGDSVQIGNDHFGFMFTDFDAEGCVNLSISRGSADVITGIHH